MSIVKMKHLRALGLREGRNKLLRRLRSLGCVQIDTPGELPPEWDFLTSPGTEELSHHLGEADELSAALETLKGYAKKSGGLLAPLPQVAEETLFDEESYRKALETARAVNEAKADLSAYAAQRGKLETQLHALEPWLEVPVALDTPGTRATDALFVSAPLGVSRTDITERLDGLELCHVTWAGEDKELRYFLVLTHKSVTGEVQAALTELGCARLNLRNWSGTAAENHRGLQKELAELDRRTEAATAAIQENAQRVFELKVALDKVNQEVALERSKAGLLDTDHAFFLDGWFPAAREAEVQAALEEYGLAYDIADPTEAEYPDVPVQLKNNPVTRPFNVITETYALPAYDSVDPNPLMAPFFIAFFGFMMNDIGYGLLMVLGTAIFLWKARPKGNTRNMMTMFFMCGLSSIFWGCLTGSFFGDFIPKLFQLTGVSDDFVWFWKPVFTPVNDIILVMIGSMALGVVQVFTGMAISTAEKFRHGEVLDAITQEIAWWVILGGAAAAIVGMAVADAPAVLGTVGLGLLVAGLGLLLVGNLVRAKGLGGLSGFGGDIYNGVSGYFSDILSYLRLMALMMAGSIIASVFNTLGSVFGLVPFVIVAIIGNVLNLVLNLLGCYVHTMRLQCLEFFGRFYKDGGKAFRPLAVETKYVDILKEEK